MCLVISVVFFQPGVPMEIVLNKYVVESIMFIVFDLRVLLFGVNTASRV